MKQIYLILCLLVNGDLEYQMTLNDKAYTSMGECLEVRDHPRVVEDYTRLFKDDQVVLLCSEVKVYGQESAR